MIDEQKLIEDIKDWNKTMDIEWTSASVISLLQSAPKIDKWILCEDRLPELDEGTEAYKQSKCVLVKIKWYDGDLTQEVSWLNQNGTWACMSSYQKDVGKVIAWQPLPSN